MDCKKKRWTLEDKEKATEQSSSSYAGPQMQGPRVRTQPMYKC